MRFLFGRTYPNTSIQSLCGNIGKRWQGSEKEETLTGQQVEVLLDPVKGLRPYLFIMLGLYSGLSREEIFALQWDCAFLDKSTLLNM